MSLETIKNKYKADVKTVFKSGYSAKTQEEALENLSHVFANSLEEYFNHRIIEINQANGVEDTLLRMKVKELIDEINKIKVISGNNINTTVTNQIKNSL